MLEDYCESVDKEGIAARRMFYYGIPGQPVLVARSSHYWDAPPKFCTGPWQTTTPVRLSPVGSHPIVSKYEAVLPEIEEAFHEIDWSVIGCYRLGWKEEPENDPVVIWVYVMPGRVSELAAQSAVTRAEAALGRFNLLDVQVHVAEARSHDDTVGKVDYPAQSDVKAAHGRNPPVGSSVGPSNGEKAGSIGFFISIKDPAGNKSYGAVSCHHVVVNSEKDQRDPTTPVAWPGVAVEGDRISVAGPAPKDHVAYIKETEKALKCHKRSKKAFEMREQGARSNPSLTWNETLLNRKHETQAIIQELEEDLERARDLFASTSTLGHVSSTSGLREPARGCPMMDWSVTQLSSSRLEKANGPANTFPLAAATHLEEQMQRLSAAFDDDQDWIFLAESMTNRHKGEVVKVEEIDQRLACRQNLEVFLTGRTSGATTGQLNQLRDKVRTTYALKGGKAVQVVSREYVILDMVLPGTRLSKYVKTFSQPGDSGAPIIDKDGRLIGILFTGVSLDESGYPASWVSPAETIIRDIEAHGLGAGMSLAVL